MRRLGLDVLLVVSAACTARGQGVPVGPLPGLALRMDVAASRVTTETTRESGSGGGLGAEYGFTSRWSLYGHLSQSSIRAISGGRYALTQLDGGVQYHIPLSLGRIVPVVRSGVAGLAMSQNAGGSDYTASGLGLTVAIGADVFVSRHVGLSAALAKTMASISYFAENGIRADAPAIGLRQMRTVVGLVWRV